MSNKQNIYAVILAGGSGTRFWPVSRKATPKQFIPLLDGSSLFQKTLERMRPLVPLTQTLVVTNRRYAKIVREQAGKAKLPSANVLLEPSGKNTAPAIAWAAHKVAAQDPDAVMVVLPSDHLITKPGRFRSLIRRAMRLARDNHLVTMGIVPTRPETGYGYLKTRPSGRGSAQVVRVEKFIEKPDAARAKTYFRAKGCYWNSGMFVWKAGTVLAAFQTYLPAVNRGFARSTSNRGVQAFWSRLPAISIDYAVLEKAPNVVTVPADIGWTDCGSWEALWEVLVKDRAGNARRLHAGQTPYLQDCRNTLVWGDKRFIAAVGLEDAVIIDTPDALLVCDKRRSQEVRSVIAFLTSSRKTSLL